MTIVADDRYHDAIAKLHRSYQVPVLQCKFPVQHWMVAYVFGLLVRLTDQLEFGMLDVHRCQLGPPSHVSFHVPIPLFSTLHGCEPKANTAGSITM